MKIRLIHLAVILCLGYTCTSQSLPARSLHPYGRYLLTDSQHIELIGSAVHFGFSFKGSECSLYAYTGNRTRHDYLQYELDGVYQKRIRIEGGSREPLVIKAPSDGS